MGHIILLAIVAFSVYWNVSVSKLWLVASQLGSTGEERGNPCTGLLAGAVVDRVVQEGSVVIEEISDTAKAANCPCSIA